MRVARLWLPLVAVPIVLGLWSLALTGLSLRDPPPPLFTKADLPALPPANENGWTEIPETLGVEPPRIDLATVTSWETIELRAAEWTDVIAQPPVVHALEFTPALERAHFLETSALGAAAPVTVLQLMKLAAVRALLDARIGRCESAEEAAGALDRAALSMAARPRTMVGYLAGVAALELVFESAARIAEKCPTAGPRVADDRESFAGTTIDGRTAVAGEYLLMLGFTELLARPVLYDAYATRREIDERFLALEHHGPSPGLAASGAGWWLHNPVGKLTIDAGWIPLDEPLEEARLKVERLRAAR